jgi:hypothetical protein
MSGAPGSAGTTRPASCYLREIIAATVRGGPGEFASRPYGAQNVLPLLALADCAKDPELAARARIAYEVCLAQIAPAWLRGHSRPSRRVPIRTPSPAAVGLRHPAVAVFRRRAAQCSPGQGRRGGGGQFLPAAGGGGERGHATARRPISTARWHQRLRAQPLRQPRVRALFAVGQGRRPAVAGPELSLRRDVGGAGCGQGQPPVDHQPGRRRARPDGDPHPWRAGLRAGNPRPRQPALCVPGAGGRRVSPCPRLCPGRLAGLDQRCRRKRPDFPPLRRRARGDHRLGAIRHGIRRAASTRRPPSPAPGIRNSG